MSTTEPTLPDWVADFLNRRTAVEGVLRGIAAGRRPTLTPDEAKALANKLSVPSMVAREPTSDDDEVGEIILAMHHAEQLAKILQHRLDGEAAECGALPAGQVEPDDLVERLMHGVVSTGLHDDNSTELFDIDDANDSMPEAADVLTSLRAERDKLAKELEEANNRAEVAEYKHGQAVNEIQPMIIARAKAAETANAKLRKTLEQIVGCYDRNWQHQREKLDDCIPLARAALTGTGDAS